LEITSPEFNLGKICEKVLRDLPDWFGIEQSIVDYVNQIDDFPTITAKLHGEVVGFITMNKHFDKSAELHVLAVKKAHHRSGIGRKLFQAAEKHLKEQGVEFVQVKTISANSPDKPYGETRKFYGAMGYTALEEFPDMWDKRNPCLQMIKRI